MKARFLLGSHQPGWLSTAGVPLFVSDTRLRRYKTLPRAAAPWALDSGGFTQLQQCGQWTVSPREYVARVRRYRDEIGHMEWCAPQDWMCEPIVISGGRAGRMFFVGTGLSVIEHQRRTVDNAVELTMLAPELPWRRVVQGETGDDYERCHDLYDRAGIDLTREPLVGLGSVCRRQGTREAHDIIRRLRARGITRLHGFGVKTLGLRRYGHLLTSADSLAWSEDARRKKRPVCGTVHPRGGKNCANCLPYALQWRTRLLTDTQPRPQLRLFDIGEAA
ncbi:hypothetical protein ADK67_05505 [Saccharothrix sp. NRRL B-16348]|uniref:deazapurine DNA modification protein DpdA family protein n=1 Tax=Saccharothrix sp. NRRL B-16348 TaxID=1415542 RepID=UPI0006AFE899|nr:hypothetical protein [Saccharothrix sp. NRRL B-16348]KOX33791.1 hypothetical protein ADK67_05505 [Saccharothrix sp. NRRL B-16348]